MVLMHRWKFNPAYRWFECVPPEFPDSLEAEYYLEFYHRCLGCGVKVSALNMCRFDCDNPDWLAWLGLTTSERL